MNDLPATLGTVLQLGDSALVACQRLCEGFGRAPTLALDRQWLSIGLDLLEHSRQWLEYAAELLNDGRTADHLAFLRDARDFHCVALLEQPDPDTFQACLRQWLFDGWHQAQLMALQHCDVPLLAVTARRALPQVNSHLQHSGSWLLDASERDRPCLQRALDRLWPLLCAGIHDSVDDTWRAALEGTLRRAGLAPASCPDSDSARDHNHLITVLQPLQVLARTTNQQRW
ncbi:Phenylacetic acid catabolic protein [Pseudomonas coleopterorum]|uniref:1,2-phenylacetyl-CoA epoxidase subunit PaaC n=1 Tax=Pseudomonas coleopterorum TaxID=1605838 RepID=UPI002A6B83AD|nr:Phenylacetic acid catabolic protein [Pseudomonas coleopterorum]MDY1046645.1 Phenylacetic acid catabolic protein [Pseudomonas coleopterorum]